MITLVLFGIAIAAPVGRPDSVGFVDSTEGHVRCHYAGEDALARCVQVAGWAEEAYAAQVTGLGFRAPLADGGRGGSDALDVYLTPEAGGAGVAWVDCDGGDPRCADPDPDDEWAAAPSYIVIDPRTSDDVFRSYVHHEFAHTLQYAADYTEPFLALWEGTAVACEHWTDPDWPTSDSDFGDYQSTPWLSAVLQDGYFLADIGYSDESWYEYGAVTWVFYMDATHGDGRGSVGPLIWEEAGRPGATVLDAWDVISGDWRESLLAFTAERARMGTAAGPAWSAFAGNLGLAAREGTVSRGEVLSPAWPPYPLGVSFYTLPAGSGALDVQLAGDPTSDWAVLVVTDTGWADLGPAGGPVGTDLAGTLAVVNLGPPGLVATDPLETASFTITLAERPADVEAPKAGCGCAVAGPVSAGPGSAEMLLVGAAMLVRRRRRGPPEALVGPPGRVT
ncbi:MAG: MYXO-CTERM sorting domain-containing protein [Pseudomonadota bacterium]|nr:MYXO-CTERM sorting domain-containing protein [Pseudomonadota bacterium]